jgi:hypothetical protein
MRLLLDFPWSLDAACGQDPVPQKVILDFYNLLSLLERTQPEMVPFIEYAEYVQFCSGVRQAQNRYTLFWRFLSHCIRNANGLCLAAPVPEPPNLRDSWKRALRDELNNFTDWRNPQLIVPTIRHPAWQSEGHEAAIHCQPCAGQPVSDHHRVLVLLEDYVSHPYATSDCDPWDVRCTAPDGKHPCYLPNPLIPDSDPLQNQFCRVPIVQLHEELADAHRKGWRASGKYFFLPPTVWIPETVTQVEWREGRAFPRNLSEERHQMGYEDFEGRIWVWHKGRGNHIGEDHWDIQFGGSKYISVNHTGDQV